MIKKWPFLVAYKVMVLLTIDGVLKVYEMQYCLSPGHQTHTFLPSSYDNNKRPCSKYKNSEQRTTHLLCFLNKVLSTGEWHLEFLAMMTI